LPIGSEQPQGSKVIRSIKSQRYLTSRAAATALLCCCLHWLGSAQAAQIVDPLPVLQAYLRATYARDYVHAYSFISSLDQRVRGLDPYVRNRGPFAGFALEAATKLSQAIELKLIARHEAGNRLRAIVSYRVPDPKSLSSLLLNWDSQRLNSLTMPERTKIIDSIERLQREGSLPMSTGQDQFELVNENGAWRVFLDWAAGIRIPFKLDLSKSPDLGASLSTHEIVTQPGELFVISLRIKNRLNRPITVRIGHLIEPENIADFVDFVQCGFLFPITIGPAKEEQFSANYLIRGSLPEGVRQLGLTYDFRPLQ
jgi:hypothetical protein